MTETELEQLKYPIGKRVYPGPNPLRIKDDIHIIETLPQQLKNEVSTLQAFQLQTPYRPGGWSVRQVVHHLGDSHMNAFCRFKLALTESGPHIKPYNEADWAELEDCKSMPIEPGLDLISSLHARWSVLLKALSPADLQKTYVHPQYNKVFTLDEAIHLYAWHSSHHLAHITALKQRNQWD